MDTNELTAACTHAASPYDQHPMAPCARAAAAAALIDHVISPPEPGTPT